MAKYYNTMVVFEEIPDEISLAINITNCPCRCEGCHSPFLREDIGTVLTFDELDKLIDMNKGISCVCFMGGDANPKEINDLSKHVKQKYSLKIGWYSGKETMSKDIDIQWFDFIKIGPYIKDRGPLNEKSTNQVLYKIEHFNSGFDLVNITAKFWKRQ